MLIKFLIGVHSKTNQRIFNNAENRIQNYKYITK